MTLFLQIDSDVIDSLLNQVSQISLNLRNKILYITASPVQTLYQYITCFGFRLPYAIAGEFKGIINADNSAP